MKTQPAPVFSDQYVIVGIYKAHKKIFEFGNAEVCKLSNMDLAKFGCDVGLKCESIPT